MLVIGARPAQLQAGLAQLDLLLGELGAAPEALRVVVNGQPELGRGNRAGALSAELAARGLGVDAWLPYDGRALRASMRRGLPLALASPPRRLRACARRARRLESASEPATAERAQAAAAGAPDRGARPQRGCE